MTSCSDIEAKMTPYVDGEMSASEAAAVDRHLEVCDPCRERSRVERAARTLVTDRASRLCALAPASLTARCEAAAASPFAKAATRSEPGRVSTRAWRAPLSVAAAALLLVAATFAFLRVSGQSDPLVASELARDHSNCFALAGDDGPAADLAYLEQSFERSFGWDPGIPVGLQTQGSNCSRPVVAPTTMGRWPTCSVVWTGSQCPSSCCHRAHVPMRTSRSWVSA